MVQCKLSKVRQCLDKALAEARDGNHMLALLLFTVYITAVSNSSVQDGSLCWVLCKYKELCQEELEVFGKWTLVSQLWWPQGLPAPAVSSPWGLSLLPQQGSVPLPHLQSHSFALASWIWAMKWPEAEIFCLGGAPSWVLKAYTAATKFAR